MIEKILEQSVSSIPENTEDYYGEDGLLYCGKCHMPREAFFAKGIALMGKNKHPIECSCQRIERTKQETLISQQKHNDLVRRLKAEFFLTRQCSTGPLKTTMGAALRCTMHIAMWSSGRPCVQRTLGFFSGVVWAPARVSLPGALQTL